MTRQQTRRFGSTMATALKAFAFVSLARRIGLRRVGRVAALATEGYLAHLSRERRRR
jgi:hypothetical protein